MTRRREKAKPVKPELNKQLRIDDDRQNASWEKKRKKLKVFMYEFGKFLVDLAKLVFGGVILAGIMDEDINRTLLFSTGTVIVSKRSF